MPLARFRCPVWATMLGVTIAAATIAGCFSKSGRDDSTIRITGSDTMVGLAQAWAEAYATNHPEISSQVRGGGSGVGIAGLINGRVDIAPASRVMTEHEIELAKEKTGKDPVQFVVGRDALAIYVHKNNPIDTISIEELAEVYGEGGKITGWKQLGVDNVKCSSDEIVRIARQNSSGTYVYFRDAVLGPERQYKQGTTGQSGSRDVVALVSQTPCAIGYSGMGYYEPGAVKMLKIAKNKGEPGVAPSVETALDNTYPISRPLYIYTLGEPTGVVQEFVEWVLGPEGQKLVADVGYVPNPEVAERADAADAVAENAPDAAGTDADTKDAAPDADRPPK